jgi:BASS family bile acid:Na+ symporter
MQKEPPARTANPQAPEAPIGRLTQFLHHHFLLILMAAYALSAMLPQFGLWLQHITLGQLQWPDGSTIKVTLPLLLLSFLLFNAGLGIKAEELAGLGRRPAPILAGFIANIAVPILLVLCLRGLLQLWHNTDELQNLLVGLALITAMPIAGSATAWAQNANGNLTLSLGLVFLSTVLSPITTPLVLHTFGYLSAGDYAEDLHELASQGTNAFIFLTVVLPSVLGVMVHLLLGEGRTAACRPYLKLTNFIALLLLNYSNAATALPQAFSEPDVDFLLFIYGTTTILCTAAFGAGWLIANWLKADSSDQASLMFGLGMNNNGTGLVLAAANLSDHPAVLLPIIFYTLVQQIIAALVDRKIFKGTD